MRILRFGIFELDLQSGELRRQGLKVRLPDQSFQILRLLLDRPGDVVTREELRQRLWSSDTSVEFDDGLNSAIRKLRNALDDSAENPRFVETLPRRGYRFIGSVTPAIADDVTDQGTSATTASVPRSRLQWIAGGLLLGVTVFTIGLVSQISPGMAERPIRSVAVLPFENRTGDPVQAYLSDAMTDLLTTELVQARGFDVLSLASAMQYKGTKKSLIEIGEELEVDALVGGTIVKSGQDVRITVRLIRTASDRHVWAKSYEVEPSVEREMGQAIAAAITGQPSSPPLVRARVARSVSSPAYHAYLKGMAAAGRQTPEGMRAAVEFFEDAVAVQPDFAAAYAALGFIQLQSLYAGPLSPREVIARAEPNVRKALELDDALAQGHRALGVILQNFYWRWEEGDKEFRRAEELTKADNASRTDLLQTGRFEEAVAAAERTLKLDPLSFGAHVDAAVAHRRVGEYDRAVASIRRALEIFPGQPRGHFQLGVTFLLMGRRNDAISELEIAVKASNDNPRFQAYLGYAYAAANRPADARRILHALESRARQQYVSSFGLALIYDALQEKRPALTAFERAYQDHAIEFAQLSQYPQFKTIASDARFLEVMRLVGRP